MSTQRFSVRGQDLGSREIPTYAKSIDGMRVTPSFVFFCSTCSEIWGRVIHEHYASYHNIWTRYCDKHARDGMDGSLSVQHEWLDDPIYFTKDWPDGAVRHEFNNALHRALLEIERESSYITGRTQGPPGRPVGHGEVLLDRDAG